MDKGLIIMVAVGAVFAYFAIGLFNTSSSQDDSRWLPDSEKNIYEEYYKKDNLGDKVLNLNSLEMTKAKSIWSKTKDARKLADDIPDFDMAKSEADILLEEGNFKTFLLQYIEKLRGRYLAGEIDSDKAKELIKTLK